MIIPKKYGGLEFSAYAHSCVLVKLASRSGLLAATTAVPNSLGPGRAAQPLRHRGAEEPLPAAPRARRGSAVFRAHASARGFRRRVAARHRHRVQGHVPGPGDRRAQAQLLQALHHARAHRHGGRPRVPALRPGQVVRRRQDRLRHHLRAHSAQHRGPADRPPALSAQRAVPERPAVGQGRVRAARHDHRRARRWRVRAGACWSSSCRWAAASRCRRTPPAARRAACSPRARTRASAASSTCRWASSKASKPSSRAWSATPTRWTRRVRSPRAPSMAARSRPCRRRCSSITSPRWAGRSRTTPWTCTAARASS